MASVDVKIRSRTRLHTHADGHEQLLRWWEPPGETVANLVVIHGYAEHSGRYESVGGALAERGFAVWSTDLRGHGRSGGERASVEDVSHLVSDARFALDEARSSRARAPLFILGHSMGGLVATTLSLDAAPIPAGLVLSGAAVGETPGIEAMLDLDPFPELSIPSEGLSRDPEVCRLYDEDPLNYRGPFRRETLAALSRGAQLVRQRAPHLDLPLLILHGGEDPIVPPTASEGLFAAARSSDKHLEIYPGLKHEILNEPEGPEIVARIAAWLAERAS
jgi:alpha-beta hydrolase superfamily lysophospholipase